MKPTLTTRGAVTLVAAAGVTVMLSGVSYAFWTVTGTGEGTAAATSAQPLAVQVSPADGLYPGASVAGTVTLTNPNPFAVEVSALSFTPPTADAAHGACTTTGVTFSSSVSSTSTITVPARTATASGTLQVPYTAVMTDASSNGCQGATFTTTVTVSGSS